MPRDEAYPTQAARAQRNASPEFDGETYGRARAYNEETGTLERDIRNQVQMVTGPEMVVRQLVRTILTPKGSDPMRPWLGLDRDKFLGQTAGGDLMTKEALIEAIGPESDTRVERLEPDDITIRKQGSNRDAQISVLAHLDDGTPVKFSSAFHDLLRQSSGFPEQSAREQLRSDSTSTRSVSEEADE